jgi:hypothetical protein
MAEQEVVKHTEKVYKIWNKKEHSFWYKLKEFIIEILIIVFAVSLSIWFHERSEHAHQQKDVKAFLLGLKGDLQNDVNEMEEDKRSYLRTSNAFRYLASLKLKEIANEDSIYLHSGRMFNITRMLSNTGRYEGFKASGKLGNIENIALQNDIVNLYEEDFPNLLLTSDIYTERKMQVLNIYTRTAKRITDSTTNLAEVLSSDEVYNVASALWDVSEIISRYDSCLARSRRVIKNIDTEYK